MISMQNNKLISLPISQALWTLAIPMMIESLVFTALNFTDMFFVGKLGKEALSAAGIVGIIVMTVVSIAFGLSIATIAIVSRRIGENKYHQAAEAVFNGGVIGFVLGIVLSGIMLLLQKQVLGLFNLDATTLAFANDYYFWMFMGRPLIFVNSMIGGALRGAGHPKQTLIANSIAVGLNIILDPILIFGYLGFPAMGISGAAIATIFSEFIGVGFMIFFAWRTFRNMVNKPIHIDFAQIWTQLKIGIPASMQIFFRFLAASVLMGLVSTFGTVTTAGFTIMMRAQELATLPTVGMGNAVATLVGQNLGAGHPDRAEKSVWLAILYNTIIIASVMSLFLIFRQNVIGFFNNEAEVITAGSNMLLWLAPSTILFPLGFMPLRGLNGAGDTITVLIVSVGTVWILQTPLCFILAKWMGSNGIWLAMIISTVISALISVIIFRAGKWKKIRV
jgi:putative MATE family efflux protein